MFVAISNTGKMLLHVAVVLCISTTYGASVKDVDDKLIWPDKYTLEATRISLTSGILEDYKVWITNSTSRLDYNKGAVKVISQTPSDDYPFGIEYEIHPETSDDIINKIKCYQSKGTDHKDITPKQILPSTDVCSFELVDWEVVNDEDTGKYYCKEENEGTEERHTVWAKYNEEQNIWTPVRYEIYEYSSWLGSLNKHDIWDFFNVNLEFDESVYDMKDYNCTSETSSQGALKVKKTSKNLIDLKKKEHVNHVFNTYKSKFNRKYAHKKEHAMRREIFKKKLSLVLSTNSQNLGYKLTLNHFADRTSEEMKKYQGLQRRPEGKVGNVPFPYTDKKIKEVVAEIPAEYDLRIFGYVSQVKNQEECGSCWTFGTTGAVEGALARINGGQLKTLSNQALVDCAWPFGAGGCDGGTDNAAYEWMMKYGLPTEAEYGSYLNRDDFCRISNMTKLYPIRGFTDVTPYSIGALKVAIINHGPLSVSIEVTDSFSLYSGGVYYDTTCTSTNLNHEVTLVGYGERDGETFWILKNSWGPNWGVDGYILISSRDNNCGVATEPTYVVF